MLIQPFAENAIRHGLLQKQGEGSLNISINRNEEDGVTLIIADDGIGIEKSHTIDSGSPLRYVSRGRELTLNRIRLMNETGYQIQVRTESSDKGTTITIQFKNHGA
jgi:sensor histidine kinase YesM